MSGNAGKGGKAGSGATHIVGDPGRRGAGPDLDKLMTAVRTAVAGHLVIVDGPGNGKRLPFFRGSNSIGRGAENNVIVLDFGDAAIHRESHAFLLVEDGVFRLCDNGKTNPVKVNGRDVSGFMEVTPADAIQIGMTRLRVEVP